MIREALGFGANDFVRVTNLEMHFEVSSGLLGRGRRTVRAVDGVSFAVRKGETLGLVGESGSGKSTTGRAMLQIYRPTSGSVSFRGAELTSLHPRELRRHRRGMQMIFQDPQSSLDPRMTISRIIAQPLEIHGLAKGRARAERIIELLRTVGLHPAIANRYPHQLSGGQRQRIGIARALAVEPSFLVLDEPVSALDVSIQAQIINLLSDLQRELALSYLFIAHDLSVVRRIADRVAVMYVGKMMEVASSVLLYEQSVHPYTRALLSAVPAPDPNLERRRKRIILTGDIPSPAQPPPGCRFHTRCWLRAKLGTPELCRIEEPRLRELRPGQYSACHFAEELLMVQVGQEQPLVSPAEGSNPSGPTA